MLYSVGMGNKAPINSGTGFRSKYCLNLCIDLIYFFQLITRFKWNMFTMSQSLTLTELMLGDHLLVWGVCMYYVHTHTTNIKQIQSSTLKNEYCINKT